ERRALNGPRAYAAVGRTGSGRGPIDIRPVAHNGRDTNIGCKGRRAAANDGDRFNAGLTAPVDERGAHRDAGQGLRGRGERRRTTTGDRSFDDCALADVAPGDV